VREKGGRLASHSLNANIYINLGLESVSLVLLLVANPAEVRAEHLKGCEALHYRWAPR
jgi:hypothetical protein